MQAIRIRPQTSEELAAQLGTSDRTIRRRLEKLPVTRTREQRGRVLYSPSSSNAGPAPANDGAQTISTYQVPEQESPAISEKGIIEGNTKVTPKNGERLQSLSACVLAVLQAEPDRAFLISDLVDRTGGNRPALKTALSRLSSAGKGSGPVRRITHGMYQYAPEKEHENLQAMARSGNWKIENLTFVTLGAQGGAVLLSETAPEEPKVTLPDASQPVPHPGFPAPWPLQTGQTVTWEDYDNGTQVIRISANGAPPISPDTALMIIEALKNNGFNSSWQCVSLELNVDSRKLRMDGSYSVQLIEGVLLKAYQHGYNTRVEIADRRKVPVREVLDLFHAIAGGMDGTEAIKGVKALEARVKQNEKDTRLALKIARQVRDREPQCTGQAPRKRKPPATFTRASALEKQPAPAAGVAEPV